MRTTRGKGSVWAGGSVTFLRRRLIISPSLGNDNGKKFVDVQAKKLVSMGV